MSLRGFQSRSRVSASMLPAVSASLSVVILVGSSGAIAAQPFQLAQNTSPSTSPSTTSPSTTSPSTSGDVVVPTEPQPGTNPGTSSGTTSGTTSGGTQTSATGTRFSCRVNNGQYTVMYSPESQPGQFYPWATPSQLGGGWSPERRCNEITRRLESYRPDGLLEMRTQVENGYNTICVTTQAVSGCRIVLTVPPGQDPIDVRDRVFQNLTVADSGQQTQGVNTLVGGGHDPLLNQLGQLLGGNAALFGKPQARSTDPINLRPFLDRRDGGTGEKLRPSASNSHRSSPRLNPDSFR